MNIGFCNIVTGQRVRKGDLLADLDTFLFNSQHREAEIALAQADLELKDILMTSRPCQMASTATPFCRIIRNTDMEVEFHILETELDMVKLGKDRIGKIAGIHPHLEVDEFQLHLAF